MTPPPDLRSCRRIFGQKLTRKLNKSGLRVLGAQYHSSVIADHLMHQRQRDVEIRWLHSDLSAIEVRLGKDWVTVPAVMDEMHGAAAQLWMSAVSEVRATDPARKCYDEKVMLAAPRDIRARSQDAQAATGLIADDWSAGRLICAEQELMIGFEVGPKPASRRRDGGIGCLIGFDEQEGGETGAGDTAAAPKGGRKGKFKLED